ncbi:MAG: transcription antitermination factor NusB [Ignavibacteriales bacterium]|nr:MAG: transcription antitermination factor NusB [Ignavibacteriales bacterium]
MTQVFKRRLVRERVLQVLYAFEMNQDSLSMLSNAILIDLTTQADRDFANDLINKVVVHRKELDKKISERVDNWEMSRIALIDKLLLRMGICEILYFPEIPPKVSINEAIEIAKEFSTAGSGKFVNGILDAILSNLKEKDQLSKTGRGLLEESISKSHQKK